jgi:hypothetical protein
VTLSTPALNDARVEDDFFRALDNTKIEMYITASTHSMAPIVQHMGIQRGMQFLVHHGDKAHGGLSMQLHVFVAHALRERFRLESTGDDDNMASAPIYMLTCPVKTMTGILIRKFARDTYIGFGDNFDVEKSSPIRMIIDKEERTTTVRILDLSRRIVLLDMQMVRENRREKRLVRVLSRDGSRAVATFVGKDATNRFQWLASLLTMGGCTSTAVNYTSLETAWFA